jgi:organic hydroperoxide reductase OsmC/OhrA
MHPFPHLYSASATAGEAGDVALDTRGAPALTSNSPREFDGPGNRWSPESLLVASVADCVVLTFRALARHARYAYGDVRVDVDGTLDRIDRVTSFTAFRVRAGLTLAPGGSRDEAERLLLKAKEQCLISKSLKAPCTFEMVIVPAEAGHLAVTT